MKALQVRNVPDDVHRELKARAALAGQSLSEYVLKELERTVQRPTTEELIERVRALGPSGVDESGADAVRAERCATRTGFDPNGDTDRGAIRPEASAGTPADTVAAGKRSVKSRVKQDEPAVESGRPDLGGDANDADDDDGRGVA